MKSTWQMPWKMLEYNALGAGMAQLVEQLIRNQQVAGSSPATSSRIPRFGVGFFLFRGDYESRSRTVFFSPTDDGE